MITVKAMEDFQRFIEELNHQLQKDQQLIHQLVAEYQSHDWESLYARLVHQYPRQAGQILVHSVFAGHQIDSTILERYLHKYTHPVDQNRIWINLALPITDVTKRVIIRHLFQGNEDRCLKIETIQDQGLMIYQN